MIEQLWVVTCYEWFDYSFIFFDLDRSKILLGVLDLKEKTTKVILMKLLFYWNDGDFDDDRKRNHLVMRVVVCTY